MHAVSALGPTGPVVNQQIPAPDPGPGEVLVEVHAVGLTAGELAWPESWPAIPGHEISGVVTGLGPGATGVAAGQEVYGLIRFDRDGGAAEYVATTPGAVRALCKRRQILFHKTPQGRLLFDVAELEAYVRGDDG